MDDLMTLLSHLIVAWFVACVLGLACWIALIEVGYRRSETRRIEQREARLEQARQVMRSDR